MKKRVTTQDIAHRAGVSKATVSYVLNGTGSVSAEMKEKVLSLAKEMGYQENRLAKATRTGKTSTIGLVLPDLSNPFFPEMAQAVVNAASAKGYSVFLVDAMNSSEEEAIGVKRLIEYAIEGIIWCPIDDEAIEKHNLSCPVVVLDRPITGFDSVYANSVKGGELQGQAVKQFGHKRIGVLSGPDRSPGARMRREGLYATLADDVKVAFDYSTDYSVNIPDEIAAKVLASDVSCVVTANDTLAIGLLRLYHQHGVRVPEDVSIIGFDDIDWADLVSPPLTTIKLPIRDMGTTAFDILLNRLAEPDGAKREMILDVSLLERQSHRAL